MGDLPTLKEGYWYRVTVSQEDNCPSLVTGAVVLCASHMPGCIQPEPDDDVYFADYEGDGNGFGTLVSAVEEVPAP
jgi:hypothetical protein